MKDIHAERILVIDFGSQYTQLIARRIRELGVYCEIHPYNQDRDVLESFGARGIVLSGGPESVTEQGSPRAPDWLLNSGLPLLGICYGMQTLAEQLGGKVVKDGKHELGYAEVELVGANALFDGLFDREGQGSKQLDVWMSHGDRVDVLPDGFGVIAKTASCPIAAMANEDEKIYAIQFHPEVTHTRQGNAIIERFVKQICGCEAIWTPGNIITDAIETIRKQVGSDEVILGLSGGVDSSVTAALLHRAIGDQLTCVFVDTGLMRYKEADQVMAMMAGQQGIKIIRVDAEPIFLDKLTGVSDPEAKRKVIGNTFIDIFDAEAAKLKSANWLAQGTIYPDVIESAAVKGGKAQVIKSHHNVGGLPEDMKLKLVEPLRELFKDEVRKIGVELGLPHEMVYRHPFPGPGLGVRILGEIKKEYADTLRLADHIFIEELRNAGLYDKVSQAFAVFLPIKSVGVVGDARRYAHVITLRAVETIDFMTARWAHLPYEFLEKVSSRIINEIPDVSRVAYDISSKPPATIEWE